MYLSPLSLSLIREEHENIEPSIEIDVVQLSGGTAACPEPKPVYPSISVAVECRLLPALIVPGFTNWNGRGLPRIWVGAATAQNCRHRNKAAGYDALS